MASVLLPTRRWTDSCADLLAQLRPTDELLVLCDRDDDPVVDQVPTETTPARVEVVAVGEPRHGSGKAHALAVGLGRASEDLVVLTDDDVDRQADWLERLTRAARAHGAASATPVFVGEGVGWRLVEPMMTTLGSGSICRYGGAWGGGVAFERDRLDEAAFRRDLERTISDDALLWARLDGVHTTPALVNRVRIPRDAGAVRDRVVRFLLTYRYWLPRATAALWLLSVLVVGLAVFAPLPIVLGVTTLAFGAYRYLGVERRTWLLAFPAALLLPIVLAWAVAVPTFEWGGRRYRWTGRFDVRIE